MRKSVPAIIILAVYLGFASCSKVENPRTVVKEFANAVLQDDSTKIESLINWEGMIKGRLQTMSHNDSIRAFEYHKNKFMESLIDSGYRRLSYLNSRIVVGKGEIKGNRAEVELSFIDKETAIQNYTKVVLDKSPDGWKIIYFY